MQTDDKSGRLCPGNGDLGPSLSGLARGFFSFEKIDTRTRFEKDRERNAVRKGWEVSLPLFSTGRSKPLLSD